MDPRDRPVEHDRRALPPAARPVWSPTRAGTLIDSGHFVWRTRPADFLDLPEDAEIIDLKIPEPSFDQAANVAPRGPSHGSL
jgi:hypothetical protein